MKKILILAIALMLIMVGCNQNTNTSEKEGVKIEATSADALFKDIETAVVAKDDPQRSIAMVDKLVADYPDYENNPVALFMLASYVYDEQLHDLDKARETYQQIVDNYPGSPFANDAAIAITQLGIPLEELIKSFEAQEEAK